MKKFQNASLIDEFLFCLIINIKNLIRAPGLTLN